MGKEEGNGKGKRKVGDGEENGEENQEIQSTFRERWENGNGE